MSPLTHLVGSWLVAAATTDNPQDRKLVTPATFLERSPVKSEPSPTISGCPGTILGCPATVGERPPIISGCPATIRGCPAMTGGCPEVISEMLFLRWKPHPTSGLASKTANCRFLTTSIGWADLRDRPNFEKGHPQSNFPLHSLAHAD
jgi:hypothetical protein